MSETMTPERVLIDPSGEEIVAAVGQLHPAMREALAARFRQEVLGRSPKIVQTIV
jgi:hypothetical protein